MERILGSRYLPLLVFTILALVVALAGVAFGGSGAGIAISSKTVKKVSAQQVQKLAPGLSVAHAKTADTATNATSASNASNAANAANAANADKVNGARVCSGTVSLQNNDVKTLCAAGPLSLEASCGINPTFTVVTVNLVSATSEAWVFGMTTDGATPVQIGEPFLDNTEVTLAEGLDLNTSPLTAKGQGAWFSAGTSGGSSLSGDVSVRGNSTAASQGTCFVTMGATAR
jgi:hypothetical protein